MPAEQLEQLFKVLEGGAEVAAEKIVKFPVDGAGAAAETSLAGEGVSNIVQFGNGAAAEVSQLTAIEAGGGTATTTGLGLLAMDVGAAGAAIAPALGILAGVGLYNLAPDFWTSVSNKLVAAGQTVGGKVRAFFNGNNKQTGFSQETIEIFKQAFLEANLFKSEQITNYRDGITPESYLTSFNNIARRVGYLAEISEIVGNPSVFLFKAGSTFSYRRANSDYNTNTNASMYVDGTYTYLEDTWASYAINPIPYLFPAKDGYPDRYFYYVVLIRVPASPSTPLDATLYETARTDEAGNVYPLGSGEAGIYSCYMDALTTPIFNNRTTTRGSNYSWGGSERTIEFRDFFNRTLNVEEISPPVQSGATLPDTNPFPQTYPNWQPWTAPENVPWPTELPNIYPVELPANNPDAVQQEAQNPDPDPEPAPWLDALLDLLPMPDPWPQIDPGPVPVPKPDPDPQPEPEPLPDPEPAEEEPDPPNPNPDPTPGPIPGIVPIPETVSSNALFTVYNPGISQLNSLGSYLWSSDIIDQLMKMWQNPLDGIISLQKVYATPSTGANQNIILGYLDSGVSAPVVTSQFQTIQCGTVEIKELKKNASDYTPYVDLHLYLPFIGFVELDPDEFMNGTLTVTYKVDMYTGTCLADVRCTRNADMPNATSLYQFSGNASQQIPLTAGTANGLISSLVSVVGAGIAVASGGALGAAGAALSVGHSLTHEMLHVGHSGSLSANAGIMGSRKPAVIIGRRHGYDANGYNELYGYPANKTVYLSNLSGYCRVKACRLRTKATQNEKNEIMELLKKGVIL